MKRSTKWGVTLLAVWPLAVLAAEAPSDSAEFEREVLREHGVPPDGAGAVEFLRQLEPSDDRRELVARLINALGAEAFRDRESAMLRLAALVPTPGAALRQARSGKNPEIRWRAQKLLDRTMAVNTRLLQAAFRVVETDRPDGALAAVLLSVKHVNDEYVFRDARHTLARLATKEDLPRIRAALGDDSPRLRIAAAEALAQVQGRSAADRLHTLLQDRHPGVRLAAAAQLGDLGDRRALAGLVSLLDAEDYAVRREAGLRLRALVNQDHGFIPYDEATKRAAAVARWKSWVADKGSTAQLHHPVTLRHSGRGDLRGNTLVITGSKQKVKEIDPAGNVVWTYESRGWGVEKLPGGNVLIASYLDKHIIEIDPRKDAAENPVWRYDGIAAMRAKPLPGGNLLIADFRGRRVIELDPERKEIIWQHATPSECFDAERLPGGNTIFGCPNVVAEVTPEGRVVRRISIDGRLNGIHALPSGNILVANYGKSQVVEYDTEGRIVWSFDEPRPNDVFRLPNGVTLIGTGSRIIERSRSGDVRVITEAGYGAARR